MLGDTVTIRDIVVDATGREDRGENILHLDGKEHPQQHGYVVLAKWLGSRVLEVVVKKEGKLEGSVKYELSPDGNTLTLSADEQIGVFDRE